MNKNVFLKQRQQLQKICILMLKEEQMELVLLPFLQKVDIILLLN